MLPPGDPATTTPHDRLRAILRSFGDLDLGRTDHVAYAKARCFKIRHLCRTINTTFEPDSAPIARQPYELVNLLYRRGKKKELTLDEMREIHLIAQTLEEELGR